MIFLLAGLATEAASDDDVYVRLLRRAMDDLCAGRPQTIEYEIVPLRDRRRPFRSPGEVVATVVGAGLGADLHMLFFHRDQDGSEKVWETWIGPMREAWAESGCSGQVVPVVPITMTEAWLLADGDTIRGVLGVHRTDRELGLGRDIEAERRPKEVLARIERRVTRGVGDIRLALAEQVPIDALRRLSAFRRWENDTNEVLDAILPSHP